MAIVHVVNAYRVNDRWRASSVFQVVVVPLIGREKDKIDHITDILYPVHYPCKVAPFTALSPQHSCNMYPSVDV